MTALRWSAIFVLAITLMGCGDSGDSSHSTSAQQQEGAQQEAAPEKAAPDSAADAPTLETVTHADAMAVVEQSEATLTVVNFWATWCVPCVEEFPAFVKLDRALDDRGVDVMFISTDFPNEKEKVVAFLAEHGVTGTSYLKPGDNTTEFVNNFNEDWSGAVPATFIYDDTGTLLAFWEGKASYEELKERVTEHLDRT